MGKKPIVSLRIFRGKKLSFNEDGSVQNENHIVKLYHNTLEWANFMKYLPQNGYVKVTVEKAVTPNGVEIAKTEFEAIKAEVKAAYEAKAEVPLTEDQKRIAALEKMLKKKSKKKKKPEKQAPTPKKPEDIALLREQYFEIFKKRPFHGWSAELLKEKMKSQTKA
jgi:hypothetical protein